MLLCYSHFPNLALWQLHPNCHSNLCESSGTGDRTADAEDLFFSILKSGKYNLKKLRWNLRITQLKQNIIFQISHFCGVVCCMLIFGSVYVIIPSSKIWRTPPTFIVESFWLQLLGSVHPGGPIVKWFVAEAKVVSTNGGPMGPPFTSHGVKGHLEGEQPNPILRGRKLTMVINHLLGLGWLLVWGTVVWIFGIPYLRAPDSNPKPRVSPNQQSSQLVYVWDSNKKWYTSEN